MIAWGVDTLIGASVLMLLVLAVRRPVAELFGARWAYALWLLPLARFLVPPLDLFGADLPAAQHTIILIPAAGEAAASPAGSDGAGQLLPLLLALWAGGAAVFVAWQQAAYGAFMLGLGRDGRKADPAEHHGIPVVASETVDGPLAVGFVRRRIVVPLDFAARYTPAERSLALEHELIHHRRGDIWWNLAALSVLALNWFNPIAHFAFRAFRTDQELACDAAVAGRIHHAGRHDYARALIKSASRPGQIAACPLNSADQLKRRLRMLKQHRASLGRTLGGSAALCALVVTGFLVASPGFAQEERETPSNLFVAAPGDSSTIISDADIAALQEKCGREGATMTSRYGEGGRSIVCGDGRHVDDPEVRRIVKTAMARARTEMIKAEKAARVEAVRAADMAEEVERATVASVDVAREVARAQAALAHVELARIDVDAIRAAAMSAIHTVRIPPIPPIPPVPAFTAQQRAEIDAAMATARAELAEVEIDQAELQRALRQAAVDRSRALRDADRERRQALREAEQARREALREVEAALEREAAE